jgi:hypothetical protein
MIDKTYFQVTRLFFLIMIYILVLNHFKVLYLKFVAPDKYIVNQIFKNKSRGKFLYFKILILTKLMHKNLLYRNYRCLLTPHFFISRTRIHILQQLFNRNIKMPYIIIMLKYSLTTSSTTTTTSTRYNFNHFRRTT